MYRREFSKSAAVGRRRPERGAAGAAEEPERRYRSGRHRRRHAGHKLLQDAQAHRDAEIRVICDCTRRISSAPGPPQEPECTRGPRLGGSGGGDADGWQDSHVACDPTPSLPLCNNHDGTFTEEGLERGLALNENGIRLDICDLNTDGWLDILKTHFTEDTPGLYQNRGKGNCRDVTIRAGLGVETRFVSWGAGIADFDNDGDVDMLIVNMNEPPSLLRNDVTGNHHWLKVLLIGTVSNRSAIGAQVTVSYGGRKQVQAVLAQASYLSVSDRRLHYGLGEATSADLDIAWPSGRSEHVPGVGVDQLVIIREGFGVVRTERFRRST